MNGSRSVKELFSTARAEGTISPQSAHVLAVVDDGHIQEALGISVDDVQASEVVLVTMMPDDSGSIRFAGNAEAVRDGHNLVLAALCESKQRDSLLVHTRYLNGFVLSPYAPLDRAIKLDRSNYDPSLGTPLYDQSVVLLATVLAKSQEFINAGVDVRTVTLIITDGADTGGRYSAGDVKKLVDDMLRRERHIVAAMGVDDGNGTDFRQVFGEMGIRDEWILTPGKTPSEIRKAFQVFSQSALRASQSAGSFSQTAAQGLGGFGS